MKVETWHFRFIDRTFEVPVHFHPTKGEFVASLPEDIAQELTGKAYEEKQTSSDYLGLRKDIQEMITVRTRELIEKEVTTKMIAYEVGLGGHFSYRVNGKKREFNGTLHRASDGLGLHASWRILIRSKLGREENFKTPEGQQAYVEKDETLMEWTEGRQRFFEGMDAKLQTILLQFHRFFRAKGRRQIEAAIDGGLLPAPSDPTGLTGDRPPG